ncbi:flippase [Salinibacillus xinjiangensis]|uniref:Oligosaccharide flippase family protein n=1 Tax=Salinibacillus xinjiangensis TaxID=1229268 RepID=A0A6G1X2L7_9BACI|nr:flippase [Salinibacillus xinjiangensis]MRG85068.1 oligosaccharide flippase family protein [Salinibacillus xinjiangensis]
MFKRDFMKKILEAFVGKASFIIFTMVFSLVCTRLYGVEIFGQYTYAFTLVSILMFFAIAGMDNGLMYFIPKNGNDFLSFSFLLNFIVSCTITVLALYFVNEDYVRLMLPLVWLVSMEQVFFGVYRATGRIKEYFFINGFISILLRVLLVGVFYSLFGGNFASIACGVYLSFFVANFIYFFQNKHRFQRINYSKKFVFYSVPLAFSAVMGVMINKIDIIMIGNMMTEKEVGIYQIAIQVANIAGFILIIFNTVFAPKISELYHNSKVQELRKLYIHSTRILGLVSFFIITLLIVFSKYILWLFGSDLIEGQGVLILRSIGQFISSAVGSVWLMLSMTGKTKIQLYGNLLAFTLNVSLNYILIPKYGINGAAFASMVTLIFFNILGYILVSRQFKIKAFKII